MQAQTPVTSHGRRSQLRLGKSASAYLFTLPALVVLLIVFFYPMVYSIRLSFFDYDQIYNQLTFNGLGNYVDLLRDSAFWNSLQTSLIWTLSSVVGQFLVGFAFALVLNEPFPGNRIVRALILIPWVTPSVATAATWRWLYHPQLGLFNDIILRLKLPAQGWLGDPNLAMLSVVLPSIFRGFPFVTIMMLAGLSAIRRDLYEAAKVDGASTLDRFLYITLPSMRYVIVVTLLLMTMWTFKSFDLVFVLTRGGPLHRTEVLPILVYLCAFQDFRYGYAATVTMLITLTNALFAILYLRMLGRQDR